MATEDKLEKNNPTQEAAYWLRTSFSKHHEKWIIGHKGDHATNLQNLGVISDNFDVVHVHSSLGVKATTVLKPPPGSSSSYEAILEAINPEIEPEIARVKKEKKSAVVFMPFPNRGFEELLDKHNARGNFLLTAPEPDHRKFIVMEDKIGYSRLLARALRQTRLERNIIPWSIYQPGETLAQIRRTMGLENSEGVFMQAAISAGGDGTVRVDTEEQLQALLTNPSWQEAARVSKLKASKAIEHAYPANGTGCIVPTPDGDCIVLVDPPSHKPVGLASLGTKFGGGAGNDWGEPYPAEILSQYLDTTTLIGRELYCTYGYTGIFGPDGLVSFDDGLYRTTETNVRFQGTTPYQTLNASMNGRLPLELVHYLVKLAENDPIKRGQILRIIGNPQKYNASAVSERGGFYIKVGGPTKKTEIKRDVNGPWSWVSGDLRGLPRHPDINPNSVYTRNAALAVLGLSPSEVPVWIKGPKVGEVVGGELAPIGYIVGSALQVFDPVRPDVTPQGKAMYDRVCEMLYA